MIRSFLKSVSEAQIAALLLGAMLVTMGWQVLTRYAFNQPSDWTEEVMRYTYVWIVFLGASAAIADRSHVAITLLPDLLPVRVRAMLEIGLDTLLVAYFVILFWVGCRATWVNMRINLSVLDSVPYAVVYVVIPLTCVTMTLRTLGNIRRSVDVLRNGHRAETHTRVIV